MVYHSKQYSMRFSRQKHGRGQKLTNLPSVTLFAYTDEMGKNPSNGVNYE